MFPTNLITRRDVLLALLIVALALFLRLERIGISDFRYDEATFSLKALHWLEGGALPLRGMPASVGIPMGPYMVYWLAIPYALFAHPLAAVIAIAVWNALGVGIFWWLVHRYFQPRWALIAALLLACNPWALLYSRKIWNPDLHLTILFIGLALACYGFGERKRWAQALALPILLLTAQFHYQGFVMGAVLLSVIWWGRKNIAWGAVAVGIALTLLSWLPLLSDIQSSDVAAFQKLVSGGRGSGFNLSPYAATLTGQLTIGVNLEPVLVQPEQIATLNAQVPPPTILYALLGLLALGTITVLWRYRRWALLLFAWAYLTTLLLTPTWVQVFDHYFILSMPALFLLIAIGLDEIMRWFGQRRGAWVLGGGLLAGALLLQVIYWRGLLTYWDTYTTPNGVSIPLHYSLNVREKLLPEEDVIIVGGSPVDTNAWIWQPLLYPQRLCLRDMVIDGSNVAVLPAHPFALVRPSRAAPYGLLEFYTAGQTPEIVPMRTDEAPYEIYRFAAAPEWNVTPITEVTALPFENGAQLTGYHLGEGVLYLRWKLTSTPKLPYDANIAAHFLDASGERVGQQDSGFYNNAYWCEGDTLITWREATFPPNMTTLRILMYTLQTPELTPIRLADGGNWLDIPLAP